MARRIGMMSDAPVTVFRVLDRGVMKEAKTCAVCSRTFTWRKKWQRNWAEVSCCSEACKLKKKQAQRSERISSHGGELLS